MADYSALDLSASDTEYVAHLGTLVTLSEAFATEVENARQGEATLDVFTGNVDTELTNARQGETDLVTNLQTYLKNGTLTISLNMNGKGAIL